MKIRVERDVLADAVQWVARSLPNRPSVPILAGLRIAASGNQVLLSSFDYETSAKVAVTADVHDEGVALVSGRLLADIARSLPAKPVDLVADNSKMEITCGSARFTLQLLPVGEYPDLPEMPVSTGTITPETFAQAVSQVIIAASRDDTLPILTGVRMEIEDDLITLLATDRYRLALREVAWKPSTPGISTSALVKAKTLNEVAKTLGGAGDLNIALSDDSELIGFESGGRRTTSLLVDGDYPKIRSLFPDKTPIHATVQTSVLVEAVRRVSLVAERNTPVRLAFTEGQVTLDAGTGEDAQASEAIEATLDGDDITVAFNPHYLSEGLGAFSSPYVRFSFTSPPKPAVISAQDDASGEDREDYRYLLMPVRLPNQ